jgi:hypothetical protein
MHVHPHDGLADPLPFVMRYTSSHPVGCSGLAFRELYANGLSLARVAEAMGVTGGEQRFEGCGCRAASKARLAESEKINRRTA